MKIEKNIPIPELPSNPSKPKELFLGLLPKMEPGDSILVEARAIATVKQWVSAAYNREIIKDQNFYVAKDGDGYRVWRIS